MRDLSTTLAVSPIALGLGLLAAAPWPAPQAGAPASAWTRPVARAQALTNAEISVALRKAAETAKSERRAAVASLPAPPLRASPLSSARGAAAPAPASETPPPPTATTVAPDGALVVAGEKIGLDGVDLPKSGAMCRRLDGVNVRCIDRVVARLSILAQRGPVECRTRLDPTGRRLGRCHVGKLDLAQDLLAAGLAERTRTAALERPGA